jgi:hypothetical protein
MVTFAVAVDHLHGLKDTVGQISSHLSGWPRA